jgi:hypothetical protein
MATDILARHEARYGRKVGRVQIVIVDAEDQPNGFATPLPFPLVTIRAVAPDGTDDFGNHEGWLRLVLTHELAHTVHLEDARGLWSRGPETLRARPVPLPERRRDVLDDRGARHLRGDRAHRLRPRAEPGLAMVLRMAALEGRFPKEDQAIYALDRWPGGQTPYLFGEAFLRRLSEQAGEDTIPRMGRQHAGQLPLPRRPHRPQDDRHRPRRPVARVGRGGDGGLRARGRRAAGEGPHRVAPVTARGIRQVSPASARTGLGRLHEPDPHPLPRDPLARPDGSEDRRLAHRNGGSGLAWTPDGRALVYGELQVFRTFSVHGDLSLVDVETGACAASPAARAPTTPTSRPTGGRSSSRARWGTARSSSRSLSTARGSRRSPRRSRASSGAGRAGARGATRSSPRGSSPGAGSTSCAWIPGRAPSSSSPTTGRRTSSPRGRRTARPWSSAPTATASRTSTRCAWPTARSSASRTSSGGPSSPSVSPDGLSVAYSSYSRPATTSTWRPSTSARLPRRRPSRTPTPPRGPTPLPAAGPVRPYRPGSMLLPRFWTPWVEGDDSEDRFGSPPAAPTPSSATPGPRRPRTARGRSA